MKYLHILAFLFSLNLFSQNNSEINEFKNFIVINILDDNNSLIILKTDTIFDITKMNKLLIGKKTDSIINSFRLKYKKKINTNTPLLKRLKKLDTILILFKHSKNEIKKTSRINSEIIDYFFNFSNNHYFNYSHTKYMNNGFDSLVSDIKVKDKRYLKKNKERIITYNLLNKNIKELNNIFFTIQNKVFYIIDCKESKKGEIKLKQVNFLGNYINNE